MPLQAELHPSRSNQNSYDVLIVGCGSIGTRHIENLRALGIRNIAVADPDPDRTRTVAARFGVRCFRDAEYAIADFGPDVVFVCTPPVCHVRFALAALNAGAHVFIEKPLSDSLDNIELLQKATQSKVVQVGYNLRFHPGVHLITQLVRSGAVGKILWARAEFGQYLPDWRPSRNYRESYTSSRELGGGIILDASHEIDYMISILGDPVELTCMAARVGSLEVDVEDCATLLIRFAGGTHADIHMDFLQREYSRSSVFAGEEGRIAWDYVGNYVAVVRPGRQPERYSYEFKPNDMYMEEIRHFFDCIRNGKAPICGIAEAARVLNVSLAARTAAEEKRWVCLDA